MKVWVSFALFEANAGNAEAENIRGGGEDSDDEEEEREKVEKEPVEFDQAAVDQAKEDGLEKARKVFERGYQDLRKKSLKEEVSRPLLLRASETDALVVYLHQRVVLLESWKALETAEGDEASVAKVQAMMPRVVKKMRKVDGDASMMEECKSFFSPLIAVF